MINIICAFLHRPGWRWQNTHGGIVSLVEMKAWVDAQDPSSITLLGDPFAALLRSPLRVAPRAEARLQSLPNEVTVTFYSTLTNVSTCLAPCTTITTGGAACINAPNTSCLFATSDLAFYGGVACEGICNGLATCGVRLEGGFCATPGTQSISVTPLDIV